MTRNLSKDNHHSNASYVAYVWRDIVYGDGKLTNNYRFIYNMQQAQSY